MFGSQADGGGDVVHGAARFQEGGITYLDMAWLGVAGRPAVPRSRQSRN